MTFGHSTSGYWKFAPFGDGWMPHVKLQLIKRIMNKQSENEFQSSNGFQSSDGVQPDYEFQEKPWYTAYDFEATRDKMTPEEMEIYKEGKDMQKMRSLTITLLKQLQHRSEQNIKVRCPKCGKKACCIQGRRIKYFIR